MGILVEGLFQNLKEGLTLVAGFGHKATQRSYSLGQALDSLVFEGGRMSSASFILSGFASILRLLTMKPKNFPVKTLKAHLVGFNFLFFFFLIRN